MRISTAALILFWVTSFNIPYWSSANVQSSLPIESSEHSCYYKYDKAGHLLSVEYALNSDKNEYYSYDASGNITEKRIGSSIVKYEYDASNQLKRASSKEGIREYFYDDAGRIVRETLNGATDVEYRYGYLDKVTEVIRNGKSVKFAYDGFGLLTEKRFEDGSVEKWVWDGIALVRRGSDIYVNEPHVSGGVPIISKTSEGVRCHEHDFLGTTLWSTDLKGNLAKNYSDTTIFGVGSIQKDVSARFTGKPYDSDLQAYVFPYRNYDASLARWRSSDPSGYPDGINQHFYAAVPTNSIDPLGCWVLIEYWSISKVFNYVDMGNAPFPGVEGVSDEGWRNTHAPAGNCGEVSIDGVFSGNNDASQQHIANTGPIPGGNYLIGNQRDNGWYRLYGNDGEGGYRYDKVAVNTPDGETVYRDGFNLHIGSNSLGCVTVPLSEEAAWKNLEDTLNNTPTVAPNPNKPNDTYRGVMIVLEK